MLKELSNEQLASIWRRTGLSGQKKIETELIDKNKAFIYGYLLQEKPPASHFKACLSAIQQSVIPALERFDSGPGYKFLSYWVWWMRRGYKDVMLYEVGLFPYKNNPHRYAEEYSPHKHCKPENVSLDHALGDDMTVSDTLGYDPEPYEHNIKKYIINKLEGRNRDIFLMLLDGCSRGDIAKRFDLSKERVRQIIFGERYKMRKFIVEGV
jgi:hypothetical protein